MIFPQQRKLMGSSAQNSFGVHWCRRRSGSTRFRRRFPRFRRRSRKFRRRSWKLWCRAGSGSTGFRRRLRRRSGRLWCRARSGSTGRRFWIRSGRLWCRARSGSAGFRRKFQRRFREALLQSQVRFNRVPKKVPEKVWEALVQPGQVQQGSGEGSRRRSRRLWCRARSGSTGFRKSREGSRKPWCKAKSGPTGSTGLRRRFRRRSGRRQVRLNRARSGSNRFKGFSVLGFAARVRKICKNKRLRLLGIPPKLIVSKCDH